MALRFVLRKEGEPEAAGARPLQLVYRGHGTTVGYVLGWSTENQAYVGFTTVVLGRFEADTLPELRRRMEAHVEDAVVKIAQVIVARRMSR